MHTLKADRHDSLGALEDMRLGTVLENSTIGYMMKLCLYQKQTRSSSCSSQPHQTVAQGHNAVTTGRSSHYALHLGQVGDAATITGSEFLVANIML